MYLIHGKYRRASERNAKYHSDAVKTDVLKLTGSAVREKLKYLVHHRNKYAPRKRGANERNTRAKSKLALFVCRVKRDSRKASAEQTKLCNVGKAPEFFGIYLDLYSEESCNIGEQILYDHSLIGGLDRILKRITENEYQTANGKKRQNSSNNDTFFDLHIKITFILFYILVLQFMFFYDIL